MTHRRRQNFYALPTSQWQILAAPPFNILSKLERVDDAIDANADIASNILTAGLHAFGLDPNPMDTSMDWRDKAKPSDMDKACTTIRQLYRDWSADGAAERKRCYDPVLHDLSKVFMATPNKSMIKVLVPGAGLGRLVHEICNKGYTVEGNELSYHQLITSHWVLNVIQPGERFNLYPFALTFSNNISVEHQLKAVKVPDIHPSTELERSSLVLGSPALERMSMTAADFILLYGKESYRNAFDAVVTVFFIDTAPNVFRYIEVIHNCLKDGGTWINLGPLLWHFEAMRPSSPAGGQGKAGRGPLGIGEPGGVELTDEELLLLVEKMGFHIESQEIRTDEAGYIQNPESMIQNMYRVSHWIARKVA